MNGPDKTRQAVSDAYAKAVCTPSDNREPCCGPVQKGAVVKLAGYTREELDALPPEAVVNSFGCGNPLAFSEVREGETVLDLGSGAGIDLLLAAKKVGPTGRAIGVDMTDEMIARAQQNIAVSGMDNLEVRKGFIEKLPVESSSVDWVISNCVINLSPEKPEVFAEIARVLKPGGRMMVSDIVAQEMPDWIRQNHGLYNSCVAGAISEEAYREGLRAAGLEDVGVRERIVYDETQLEGFIASELPDNVELAGSCCCEGPPTGDTVKAIIVALVGKIWSAKIHARKPG
jgi:SAM-dependent methyltransferase